MSNRARRVGRVVDYLNTAAIAFELKELTDNTATAVLAAQALSCQVAEIAKSIVFRRREDDAPIIAVLCGDNRVDIKKLAAVAGGALAKADADFVKTRCGFEIGGVSPVGHRPPTVVHLENNLQRFPVIWAAAGSAYTVFGIAPATLAAVANAGFADFAE